MKVSEDNENNWDIGIIMLNNLISINGISRKLSDIAQTTKLHKTPLTQLVGSTAKNVQRGLAAKVQELSATFRKKQRVYMDSKCSFLSRAALTHRRSMCRLP